MSTPPRISQLSGDYTRDRLPVQQAFDSIGACLKNGIDISHNVRGGIVEFRLRAPTPSTVTVRYAAQREPALVTLVGMWRVNPYTPISVAGTCSWSWNNGILTLPWLGSMAGTDEYIVRLFVWEA